MTKTDYKLGDTLPNGEIYLGCLNGEHISTSANSDMETSKWHDDKSWPSREEGLMLWRLFQQKPELFKFGEYKAIWTSEVHADYSSYAWLQRFDAGEQHYLRRDLELSVRPVRRFKSFDDLIISSPLLDEILKIESIIGHELPAIRKALGAK